MKPASHPGRETPYGGEDANLLAGVVAALRTSQVRFCLLREPIAAPDGSYTGDVDFLVAAEDRPPLKRSLVGFCRGARLSILIEQRHNRIAASIHPHGFGAALKLDFATAHLVRDAALGRYFYLVWDDLAAFVRNDADLPRLDPDLGLPLYLAHVGAKPQKIASAPQKVLQRVAAYGEQVSAELRPLHRQAMGLLKSAGHARELNGLAVAMLRERFNLRPYGGRKPAAALPPVVSIVGPDGAGKTTVVFEVMKEFGDRFDRIKIKTLYRKRLAYRVLKALLGWRYEDANSFDEAFHFTNFVLARRYFASWRPRQAGGKGVLFDRYFYDLVLKGVRSRIRPRRVSWWNWAAARTPPSDLVVVLDVPYEIAYARKPDLLPETWPVIYDNYLDLSDANDTPRFAVCPTEVSFDQTRDFVFGLIRSHLAHEHPV